MPVICLSVLSLSLSLSLSLYADLYLICGKRAQDPAPHLLKLAASGVSPNAGRCSKTPLTVETRNKLLLAKYNALTAYWKIVQGKTTSRRSRAKLPHDMNVILRSEIRAMQICISKLWPCSQATRVAQATEPHYLSRPAAADRIKRLFVGPSKPVITGAAQANHLLKPNFTQKLFFGRVI